jgi:hypothetical protein
MRLNVYSQELITEATELPPMELDVKTSNTGLKYSVVRLFLHSSERLHQTNDDDDRSALAFWLPASPERREYLAKCFEQMALMVREAPPETGLD